MKVRATFRALLGRQDKQQAARGKPARNGQPLAWHRIDIAAWGEGASTGYADVP
jgi:hypothetical protein